MGVKEVSYWPNNLYPNSDLITRRPTLHGLIQTDSYDKYKAPCSKGDKLANNFNKQVTHHSRSHSTNTLTIIEKQKFSNFGQPEILLLKPDEFTLNVSDYLMV